MTPISYKKELTALSKKNRLRKRVLFDDSVIDLASNDYLGLAENKEILRKAYEKAITYKSHAAKASCVVNGYHEAHFLLEEKLKKLNNFEEALVVGSGFLANLALFELGRKGDLFLVDEEYHASGLIGAKLTNAQVSFFKHNSLEDLQKKAKSYTKYNRVFVVTEGVFSMRGDILKREIAHFAHEIGMLIIDEAHSVGVLGDNLNGITEEYRLNPKKTIKMGTLGKALGSYGAYILANEEIIEFLINRAKSVIYTTALSVMDSLIAYFAFEEIEKNLIYYKQKIKERMRILKSPSLIKTLNAKNIDVLMQKQQLLLDNNILIGAIRPPTVKTPIFRIIGRINVESDIILNTINFLKD